MITNISDFLKNYREEYKAPPKKIICGGGIELKDNHNLIILAGLPGTGKSSYLLHLASELSQIGYTPLFITFEMSDTSLIERIISQHTLTNLDLIQSKRINPESLESQISKHINFNLQISSQIQNEKELKNDIDTVFKNCSNPILIWDYLQKMYIKNGIDDKTRAGRNLEMICKVNDIYKSKSIAASSLNRAGYEKSDLSIFKESGDIEFTADMAILMRLAMKDGNGWKVVNNGELDSERKNKVVNVNFNILKNRHGEEKSFVMEFRKETQSFHKIENVIGGEEEEAKKHTTTASKGRPRTRWIKEQEAQNELY